MHADGSSKAVTALITIALAACALVLTLSGGGSNFTRALLAALFFFMASIAAGIIMLKDAVGPRWTLAVYPVSNPLSAHDYERCLLRLRFLRLIQVGSLLLGVFIMWLLVMEVPVHWNILFSVFLLSLVLIMSLPFVDAAVGMWELMKKGYGYIAQLVNSLVTKCSCSCSSAPEQEDESNAEGRMGIAEAGGVSQIV
jgi:hypothetical protein